MLIESSENRAKDAGRFLWSTKAKRMRIELYRTGREGGKAFARDIQNRFSTTRIRVHDTVIGGAMNAGGWGRIKKMRLEPSRGRGIYHVENSPEAAGKSDMGCVLWRAQAAGVSSYAWGIEVHAIETKCQGKGNLYCEFIVKPTHEFDLNSGLVQEQLPLEEVVKAKKAKGLPVPHEFEKLVKRNCSKGNDKKI